MKFLHFRQICHNIHRQIMERDGDIVQSFQGLSPGRVCETFTLPEILHIFLFVFRSLFQRKGKQKAKDDKTCKKRVFHI